MSSKSQSQPKVFDMAEQLAVGRQGVLAVKAYLETRGYEVRDYKEYDYHQKRGIDLLVPKVGFLEVKTDTYDNDNIWLEVEGQGVPGGLFNTAADYVVYYKQQRGMAYVYRRAELQWWLALNYYALRLAGMLRVVQSKQGTKRWHVTGVPVPRKELEKGLRYKKKWKVGKV